MKKCLVNEDALSILEDSWLEMKPWKRRTIRLLFCSFLSFLLFIFPFLIFSKTGEYIVIQALQFIVGIIIFYITSLLLTAIARNRRENARLNVILKEKSLHDSLTGLYNDRQHMQEQLQYLSALARRSGESIAILFADLDGLKQINDNYSHLAGDSAIVATGKRIKDALRSTDMVFRFGGDEFFIITSLNNHNDLEGELEKVSEKINKAVSTKPIHYGEDRIPLKISIGAHILNPENTVERELLIVDKKMYKIKKTRV